MSERVCQAARLARGDSPECSGPPDQDVILYVASRVVSRTPACYRHGAAEEFRASRAGGIARALLVPAGEGPDWEPGAPSTKPPAEPQPPSADDVLDAIQAALIHEHPGALSRMVAWIDEGVIEVVQVQEGFLLRPRDRAKPVTAEEVRQLSQEAQADYAEALERLRRSDPSS